MPMRIDQFLGRYFFLSNYSPSGVKFDGELYPSVEHAFAAAKTLDPEARAKIRAAGDPEAAQKQGCALTLRPDWEAVKVGPPTTSPRLP